MFRILFAASLIALLATSATAFEAPAAHRLPDAASQKALQAHLHPLAPEVVARHLARSYPTVRYGDYAGQAAFLKAQSADSPALEVAAGLPIQLAAADIFGKPAFDGASYQWLGAIASQEALALRVQVSLWELAEDERLWVLDPQTGQSFGPFTAVDDAGEGLWLPTIMGDTVTLLLESPRPVLPALEASTLSHFYESPFPKQSKQTCPENADCDTRPAVQDASTGVGLMRVTRPGGSTGLCSGSLLNNPDTEIFEPLFLTANHCFGSGAGAGGVEVVWDFRTSGCAGAPPNQTLLPRSRGLRFLGVSTQFDVQLIELNTVPSGDRGRTYLGWSTRAPIINEPVLGIHHPRGTTMKLSRGFVDRISSTSFGRNQTRVSWDTGITEGGSSGSPLLFVNTGLTVTGVLSNGNQQSCSSDAERIDFYSSFRDFFPQVACHLTADQPCTGGNVGAIDCPAKSAFGEDSEMLMSLRQFRDQMLMPHAWGREWVAAYYAQAPQMAAAVSQSSEARKLFIAMATPFAWLGKTAATTP